MFYKALLVCLLGLIAYSSAQYSGVTLRILTWSGIPPSDQAIIYGPIHVRAGLFGSITGANIIVTPEPNIPTLYQKILADLEKPYAEREYDGYTHTLAWLNDFAPYLEDLSTRVAADTQLQWNKVFPFYRQSATLGGKTYAIVVDGDIHLAYYRRDLLAAANFSVPTTWDEWNTIAAYFNGRDFNNDAVGDYGSCITKTTGAIGFNFFNTFFAGATQSLGSNQGFAFKRDMTPLINTPAGIAALNAYRQTYYNGPHGSGLDETDDFTLNTQRDTFIRDGRCALSLDWGDTGRLTFIPGYSSVKGKIGTTILPGWTNPLNRCTGALEACENQVGNTRLCPYSSGGVNRAPFAANGGGHGMVMRSDLTAQQKNALYDFFSYVSSPAQSTVDVLNGNSGFDPYRPEHLDISKWIASGMDPIDAHDYLNAIATTLSSNNIAYDFRMKKGSLYQTAVDNIVLNNYIAGGASTAQTATDLEAAWNSITNSVGRSTQSASYAAYLGDVINECPSSCPTCPTCPTYPTSHTCPNKPDTYHGGHDNYHGHGKEDRSHTAINFFFADMLAH